MAKQAAYSRPGPKIASDPNTGATSRLPACRLAVSPRLRMAADLLAKAGQNEIEPNGARGLQGRSKRPGPLVSYRKIRAIILIGDPKGKLDVLFVCNVPVIEEDG